MGAASLVNMWKDGMGMDLEEAPAHSGVNGSISEPKSGNADGKQNGVI